MTKSMKLDWCPNLNCEYDLGVGNIIGPRSKTHVALFELPLDPADVPASSEACRMGC